MASFTFLTNHAQVLLSLQREPEARMRDVAAQLAITERAVQRIVAELSQAGYLVREKHGRRNRYQIRTGTLRDEIEPVAAFEPPDRSPRLGRSEIARHDSFID